MPRALSRSCLLSYCPRKNVQNYLKRLMCRALVRHRVRFHASPERSNVLCLHREDASRRGPFRVDTDNLTAKAILRSIRRHERLSMIVIIGMLVVVIAAMVLMPRLARSAPSEPAEVTMTGAAGKKILAEAADQGWECYRSTLHHNWGDAHRCFKTAERKD